MIATLATLLLFSLTGSVAVVAVAAYPYGHTWSSNRHDQINIRLPPAIDHLVDTTPPAWQPMPPGWYYGDCNSEQAYISAYAFDTPRRGNNASAGPGWVDVWDTVGAGQLSYFQNGWQLLAWGYDYDGMGYMVNDETAVVADQTLLYTLPCR
ncbi:hypothetical protein LTR53_015473 [Teratosphaeriaceae sp. CCFEE 6253]|nr:hypothetical protein LTR53_015473 [Teratosphaeriaceae sp. CCFEE 6253]